jgi:hypothetical protein
VFHGVRPPAQLLLVPDRMRDAEVTFPAESKRTALAPPPLPDDTSELET